MRPSHVLVLALTAGLFVGCTTDRPVTSTSWLQRFRPFQGADVVQMEVALLEVPAGDNVFNAGLWTFVDEQTVPLEKKDVLEGNGFRVGQASATPPPELQDLLTSERSNPDAHHIQMHSGKAEKPLELGPPRPKCHFLVRQGEQSAEVELEQAQGCLLVVPTLTDDGRTHLAFTPQVRHAANGLMPWRPKADRSGWARQPQAAVESYAALGWEVTLAPGEYVLIGARSDRPDTLGYACFVRNDEPAPVQRLLVIRTSRAPAAAEFMPAEAGAATRSRPPPLALQVNWSSARGLGPNGLD